MMKIGMENQTIISTSTFLFRHGTVDDFMNCRSPVKNRKEGIDNLLIVG